METLTPKNNCLKCGHELDAATGLDNDVSPVEGDITFCINCASLLVFNKDLTLRLPTDSERIEYTSNPAVIQAQIIIQGMPGKQKWRR